jgi:hypothetical protein
MEVSMKKFHTVRVYKRTHVLYQKKKSHSCVDDVRLRRACVSN